MANGYRPRIEPPQTAWARHIDAYMRRENLSSTEAFEMVGPALGLGPKSRAAFRPFLIDREPDEREAAALASVFGWPDPTDVLPEPELAPDLATAILALANQLAEMRAEVAQLREERQAWQRGVVSALAELGGQAPAALLASLAPQPS